MIASPAVRRLTPWFPWPARRYARGLFDLTAGFVYAQVVQALVASGLLERLGERPLTCREAALLAELPPAGTETLLKAAASLDLVEAVGDFWMLGRMGAALRATPGLAEMIAHHRLFYEDLADPLALLRGEGETRLGRLWDYGAGGTSQDAATYSALMAATQPMVAEQAIAAYSFRRHRRLLDVGGGSGAFLAQVGRVAPHLELALFDRPGVAPPAWPGITRHSGDFLHDALPGGFDLVSLVRVLHDHDDAPVMALLGAVRAALSPGGRLLIVEPLAGTVGARAMGDAYFGLYLTAMRSGRPRRHEEYARMLRQAGFRAITRKRTPVPLITSVIIAQC